MAVKTCGAGGARCNRYRVLSRLLQVVTKSCGPVGAVDEHLAAEQLRSRLTNRVNCIDEHASFRDSFTLKALRHVIKSERRDEADKMKTCT